MNKKILITITIILIMAAGYYWYQSKAPVAETTNTNTVTDSKNLNQFSFFITSTNPGNGGNFGGIAGADQYCQSLATSVGSTKTWRAYLSGTDASGNIVNAKDRIGTGPWYNIFGTQIASDVANLHSENNLNKQTALDENGNTIPGRGDTPNNHDILTGSNNDGTASTTNISGTTCNSWTAGASSSAIVGHFDRVGRDESAPMKNWATSHTTRGCSLEELRPTGGAGLMYCFAVN